MGKTSKTPAKKKQGKGNNDKTLKAPAKKKQGKGKNDKTPIPKRTAAIPKPRIANYALCANFMGAFYDSSMGFQQGEIVPNNGQVARQVTHTKVGQLWV